MEEIKSLCDVCPHNKGQYKDCNDGQDCFEAADEIVPKLYKEIEDLEAKLAEKEKTVNNYGKFAGLTLREFYEQQNQDKISFAVEQLSKTKNFVNGQEIFSKFKCESKVCRDILQAIDNQIKQLKAGESETN